MVNGVPLDEPYAAFEPAAPSQFRDNFPAQVYTDPDVDPEWWRQMQTLTQNGELVVPPDEYFVLGDNRNHSYDSRSWGFVPRQAIIARPLVIYFSVRRPRPRMCNRPRMIDSDTIGNSRHALRHLRAGSAFFALFIRVPLSNKSGESVEEPPADPGHH